MSCLPQRGGNGRILTGVSAALPDIFDLSVGGQVRWGSVAPMLEPRVLSIAAMGRQRAYEPALRGGKVFGIDIGREHVGTPVTNANLVCRLLVENKKQHKLRTQISDC